MKPILNPRAALAVSLATLAFVLAACSSAPSPARPPVASMPAQLAEQPAEAVVLTQPSGTATGARTARPSQAATPRAYRADAATHLYSLNHDRIYKGKLPPLLYAIGVLQVEVDRHGNVEKMHWMRAPSHAPEVVAEIERTVRAAAPFPAPARMGKVVYTDTWLWHKSGRFQLDTLTEGQL